MTIVERLAALALALASVAARAAGEGTSFSRREVLARDFEYDATRRVGAETLRAEYGNTSPSFPFDIRLSTGSLAMDIPFVRLFSAAEQ